MDKNNYLTPYSQSLRKNMTKEERHLWYDFLKGIPFTVHRQKVFGQYIAVFYIAKAKIVIELDGSQHYEPQGQSKDTVRDRFFAEKKIKVLRYSNYDINHSFDAVCQDILNSIEECGRE